MTNGHSLAVQPPGLSIGDVYYAVFRHKFKLLLCIVLGLVAAAAVQFLAPPPYQSEAKLYVRYVLSDKAMGPAMTDAVAKSPDQRGETIMNSELEILTSADVARQVAETIGPAKILAKAGGGADLGAATAVVRNGLVVRIPPYSSVMHIAFSHPDPEVVQPVLREIVARYLKTHVEAHTSSGMLGDVLSQETDQLRARLAQTEEALRNAMNKAGVITVEDAKKMYGQQIADTRRELFSAEADLAMRVSALEEINKRLPAAAAAPAAADTPVPPELLAEYRSLTSQIGLLQKMLEELMMQFTPQNPRVVEVRNQLTSATERREKMQQKYPRLAQLGLAAERPVATEANDPNALATSVAALKAKIAVLKSQLDGIHGESAKLEQMEGTIVELRRKKDLEEANYRYYSASLEQSRINETLGNGRISNITQIQTASAPFSDRAKTDKLMGLIAGAGVVVGLAWVFLIELYLDRTIKRPVDLERTVPAPLLIAIPALGRRQLVSANGNGTNGQAPNSAPTRILPAKVRPLLAYHETLRDRIIGYFESVGFNHKPKLVAVTGLAPASGVTTTAAGLARSLSETGEGNVLLVDMSSAEGAAQQFTKGRAVPGLDDILAAKHDAHVEQNLYVVSEDSQSDRLSRNLPQRFTKLMPKLKASDFDYIIFDMPLVNQISITPRLAGFMDLVLLVVESERTDRDLVRRATRLLAESRAHVGVVLNKTRRYIPVRLYQESLS